MPIAKVAADIELIGVCIDQEFGERLKLKYNKILEEIDAEIAVELSKLSDKIAEWRLSPDANTKQRVYQPKKTKMTEDEIKVKYPHFDDKLQKWYKEAKKSPAEQLEDPINLASPTQLAILFYDILKCPTVSKKSPRGTGKEELEAIAERKPDLILCNLLLERRGIVKLITTYIDVLPALAQHWPDGRIRYKLNSVGTDTGRFSSGGKFKFLDGDEQIEISGFNSQNIPSRGDGKITRLLFEAKKEFADIEVDIDRFTVHETAEIETTDGWKYGKDIIALKDSVLTDEGPALIEAITYNDITKEYEFIVRKC
jgi:DNA polymerase I-like protein with 3'-5' exonuclease and polymerase domains